MNIPVIGGNAIISGRMTLLGDDIEDRRKFVGRRRVVGTAWRSPFGLAHSGILGSARSAAMIISKVTVGRDSIEWC